MDREIDELLRKLANISEHKKDQTKRRLYRKFFNSLSLNELANLTGYAIALKETGEEVANIKILKEGKWDV